MSSQLHEIRDPASGSLIGQVPDQGEDQVAAAVARARAVQPAWANQPFRVRAAALRKLARALRDDPRLIEILTQESGKPRYEAELFELLYTLELTRFYTSGAGRRALADEVRGSTFLPNKRARVVYHARGVVGVIGPWNWPLLNNFADAIGPLLAGNAVVLKPSEWTPLTSLRVAELWREAGLPDGVFQVVTGGVETGKALVAHSDMIFFTGSHRGGTAVAQAAAARLIPCVLELGGKSAMIVCADADLERAARAAVWSGFAHSGQVCIRTERVFVEEPVAERFTALCAEYTRALTHGPGADKEVFDVGAMTFPPQMERARLQVEDAVAQGAKLLAGGGRADKPGNFFAPTLLGDAKLSMRVMTEETFSPVLPIMRVSSAEEALRLTNESTLGLSGSIWSSDTSRARELARRVESGTVCVNDVLFNYLYVEAPLGGVKQSGIGLRHGPESLRQFTRIQTIVEDRPLFGLVSKIIMRMFAFPYQRKVLELVRKVMKLRY